MIALIFAAAFGIHHPKPVDYMDMVIEKVHADARGIDVDFSTSRPPPYVVAVFPMHQWGLPYRSYPYAAVVTDLDHARIDGNFLARDSVFVQVFDAGVTNGWDCASTAVMKPAGVRVWKDGELCEVSNAVYVVTSARVGFDPASGPAERRARRAAVSQDFKKPVDVPVRGYDPFGSEWMSEAFYEGRSNAWPLRRAVAAITSYGGAEIAVDTAGNIGYTSVTNAPEGVMKPLRKDTR